MNLLFLEALGRSAAGHHCVFECTRFSCSVIHWFQLWRWLSVSKTLPSLTLTTFSRWRTSFLLYFAMESWHFENCFEKSNLVMRTSVSKEKRSVDQVWRIGNWAEKYNFEAYFLCRCLWSFRLAANWIQSQVQLKVSIKFDRLRIRFQKSRARKKSLPLTKNIFGLTSFTCLLHPVKRCTNSSVLLKKQRATTRHKNSIKYCDRTLLNIVSQ